jgi:hypothetical protein
MKSFSADEIINAIEIVSGMYFRLLFVASPAGLGKTSALQNVQKRRSVPLVNANLELSRNMLDLTESNSSLSNPISSSSTPNRRTVPWSM